jgi:hypothetical protein
MRGLSHSPGWTRTNNPPVNSRMLCQLSYRGTVLSGPNSSGDREPFVLIPAVSTGHFRRTHGLGPHVLNLGAASGA